MLLRGRVSRMQDQEGDLWSKAVLASLALQVSKVIGVVGFQMCYPHHSVLIHRG